MVRADEESLDIAFIVRVDNDRGRANYNDRLIHLPPAPLWDGERI
ncbi:hypothetical protein V1278_005347 [Bradyrhizobium sp. AZCC 1577]